MAAYNLRTSFAAMLVVAWIIVRFIDYPAMENMLRNDADSTYGA